MRIALLAALLAVAPARRRPQAQVFSRVMQNGSLLKASRSTLNLTGPLICADNGLSPGGGSIDCACPNTGVIAQGMVQFTLAKNGQTDISAPWVTANTIPVCTPIGQWPMRISIVPDPMTGLPVKPGVGFTVSLEAPDLMVGIVNVGCIGAVPSP